MNPDPQTPKSGPSLVRDVTPPTEINAEIVDNIPVKNPLSSTSPAGTQPLSNPAAKVVRPLGTPQPASDDKELGHILQDVNSRVKQAENTTEPKPERISGAHDNVTVEKTKTNQDHIGSPPIIATVVACLVALLLSAAVVYFYREGL